MLPKPCNLHPPAGKIGERDPIAATYRSAPLKTWFSCLIDRRKTTSFRVPYPGNDLIRLNCHSFPSANILIAHGVIGVHRALLHQPDTAPLPAPDYPNLIRLQSSRMAYPKLAVQHLYLHRMSDTSDPGCVSPLVFMETYTRDLSLLKSGSPSCGFSSLIIFGLLLPIDRILVDLIKLSGIGNCKRLPCDSAMPSAGDNIDRTPA